MPQRSYKVLLAAGLCFAQNMGELPPAVHFIAEPAACPLAGYVSALDAKEAWIGLDHTTDGGITCTAEHPPKEDAKYFSDPIPSTFFITGRRGLLAAPSFIWETEDGGETWVPVLRGAFTAIGFQAEHGWMGVRGKTDYRNYVSDDGGRNWRECGIPWNPRSVAPWNSASFIDARNGWATVARYDARGLPFFGGVARTADGGCSWKVVWRSSGYIASKLRAIQFVDIDNGWALGTYAGLLRTIDGGHHWRRVTIPLLMLEGMYLETPSRGWILGSSEAGGVVYGTDDAGKHWTLISERDFVRGTGLAARLPARWGEAFIARANEVREEGGLKGSVKR